MENSVLHHQNDAIVSFDSEPLILVDDQDQEIGHLDKLQCHTGQGKLHRAFSLFIFNDAGELLLQKRSANKRLWPLYWSNSCCSHPRRGEIMNDAVARRSQQELGVRPEFQYLYKFIYQTPYFDVGAEHELCWVFAGKNTQPLQINETEIADWRFISANELNREMQHQPELFTPWFKMEWQRLQKEHSDVLKKLQVKL